MGKSIEHLQCHRNYIQHIWRYGSRFLTYFGMVTSEFLNFGRPVGAPALKNHCAYTNMRQNVLKVLNTWPISYLIFLILKPFETKLETLVSYVIPYCETSPTQIDVWEFAPSHRCRFPDNFLLLCAPERCAWWFDGFAEGRNPWIWKTSHPQKGHLLVGKFPLV